MEHIVGSLDRQQGNLSKAQFWTTILAYWHGIVAIDAKFFTRNMMIAIVTFPNTFILDGFSFKSHYKLAMGFSWYQGLSNV